MAIMVIGTCKQIEGGLPKDVKWRMYVNIILDFTIGLIPIISDVADALLRANVRNVSQDWILRKVVKNEGCKNGGLFRSNLKERKKKKKSSLRAIALYKAIA
jgi:hypothetical protein